MNLRKKLPKKHVGMALPLVLIFLLVGAVLVGTALYVVGNMFSTSRHVVTETQLYNAAQSGIEQGKMVLWESRADLDFEQREYIEGEIDSIRARAKDSGPFLDVALQNIVVDGLPGVKVNVDILDCNYELASGNFENLDEKDRQLLPPRFLGGEGSGSTGGTEGPPEGTSVIIDPSRFFDLGGGGGGGGPRFVVRSSAFEDRVNGQEVKIEVLVVLRP